MTTPRPTRKASHGSLPISLCRTSTRFCRDAEPLDEPVAYRYPSSVRNRYDRLSRFPEGLAVLGDAVCALNPIYGQGMTVAALEAAALRPHLADGQTRDYLREVGRISGVAWAMALGADLSFPEVEGTRTPATRLLGRYIRRLQAGAEHDAQLGQAFLRVTSMVDPPSALLRPSVVVRTLTARSTPRRNSPQPADRPS